MPNNQQFAISPKRIPELLLSRTKWEKHGAKQCKPSDMLAELNRILEEGEDGGKRKKELISCQYLLSNRESHQRDTPESLQKNDSAAKIKITLGFVFQNFETE